MIHVDELRQAMLRYHCEDLLLQTCPKDLAQEEELVQRAEADSNGQVQYRAFVQELMVGAPAEAPATPEKQGGPGAKPNPESPKEKPKKAHTGIHSQFM